MYRISTVYELKTKIPKIIKDHYDNKIHVEKGALDSVVLTTNENHINKCNTAINDFQGMKTQFVNDIRWKWTIADIKDYIDTTIKLKDRELYNGICTLFPQMRGGGNTNKNRRRKRKSVKQKKKSRGSIRRKNTTNRRTSRY